jgi:hypothetical protein
MVSAIWPPVPSRAEPASRPAGDIRDQDGRDRQRGLGFIWFCPNAAFAGTLEGPRATFWSMLPMAARIRKCVLVIPILAGACAGDDAEPADGLSGTSGDADTRTTETSSTSAGNGDSGIATRGSTGKGDTGGDSEGDGHGPKYDVGTQVDLGRPEEGCQKIDFLFVIDNSGSMGYAQTRLTASFPGFLAGIQEVVGVGDYHVMVVDTDTWADHCPAFCNNHPGGGCEGLQCPVSPPGEGCDITLGAGNVRQYASDPCGLPDGVRYATADQPNLADTFACMGTVGTHGHYNERPMASMMEAVTSLQAAGECNEGFLRDDALLVVTIIGDEDDDGNSPGHPSTWKDTIVDAKDGNENAIVVHAILPDPGGICPAESFGHDAPRLRTFATSFEHGTTGSICAEDYAGGFAAAVDVIDVACDEFHPAG